MFYFDLKWNMTLQCSLLVNEIYETFLNCPFPAMISPVKQLNAHRPVMHITPVCCRVIFSRSQDLRWFLRETLWHCECVWLEALIWWDSALASRACFVIFSLWSLNMFILLMSHRKTVFKITFMQALIWVKAGFLHRFFFLQVNYCPVLVMQFHYDLGILVRSVQLFRPPLLLWDKLL